ncbi:hypothetical protein HFP15_33305 [Amycolatopsis sp. K13G38]|uniref:Mce-associated membrane protein n=1 Tax=Amycolatopsis acididurans TaxID=2724524 RepID=A0ABX1JDD5_9PSEU|nr:hypothetical protein [Amycolatopsis acididurans]NKQ57749.1 hypothetical protein [Amycolatopsis acididurans]
MTETDEKTVDEKAADEPVEEKESRSASRRWWPAKPRLRTVVPVALVIILLGLIVTGGVVWWRGRQTLDEGPQAVARQEAQNFFSLDFHSADADMARVLDLAADPFKADYTGKQQDVRQGLTSKSLVLTAALPDNAAAIEYEHGDTADVLVAVDVTTKTPNGQQEVARNRVREQLKLIDGRWLVAQFNQVG